MTRARGQSQEQLAEVRERLAQLEPAVVEQPATEPIPAPEPEPVPVDPRDVYVQLHQAGYQNFAAQGDDTVTSTTIQMAQQALADVKRDLATVRTGTVPPSPTLEPITKKVLPFAGTILSAPLEALFPEGAGSASTPGGGPSGAGQCVGRVRRYEMRRRAASEVEHLLDLLDPEGAWLLKG